MIIMLLYLASLVNLLSFFGLILPRIGVILGVYFTIYNWRKNGVIIKKMNMIPIAFFGYFMLLAPTLMQSQLLHYDNFSHWALIVKYLLTQQSLPDVNSTIIGFSSYPIGTSLWCYYFVNFVGFNDGVMIFAQFCLIMACLYAMVAVIKDKNKSLTFAVMFLVMTLFNYFNIAIRMNNLLVDFILPLITLAALASIFFYRKNMYFMAVMTVFLTGVLGIVKNNSLFFVMIVLGYFVLTVLKYRDSQWPIVKKMLLLLSTVTVSLAPYLLWLWHINQTFGQQLSKHEVSVTAYQDIYEAKTPEIIYSIIQEFCHHIMSLSTVPTQGVIVINALFIVTIYVIHVVFHQKTQLIKGFILTNGVIIFYYIGILLMFVFSMPNEEALALAGFDRYAASIVTLGLGVYAFFAVRAIDQTFYEQDIAMRTLRSFASVKKKYLYQYMSSTLFFVSALLILSENNGMQYNLNTYPESLPYKIKQLVGNHMILNKQKYLIISADRTQVDNYLTQYVGKYYLYSSHVDATADISQLNRTQFIHMISQYDDVLVIDKHYTFQAMSRKYLHRNIKKGIYSTTFLLKYADNN
ncbi:hypothetical protein [Leuconostoc aquikimchii]|uniref:Glycosyltransferase RgtA/B/C/D-like domain-containing protein n=2 Tax=Leuconostoc aquikimchii TaxID=3236804 RepID=A0ABV3S5G8_9LACO